MADTKPCSEDVCLWPDGTWCFGEDLRGYLTFMSDDFERIPFGTPAWDAFEKE